MMSGVGGEGGGVGGRASRGAVGSRVAAAGGSGFGWATGTGVVETHDSNFTIRSNIKTSIQDRVRVKRERRDIEYETSFTGATASCVASTPRGWIADLFIVMVWVVLDGGGMTQSLEMGWSSDLGVYLVGL